jgi:hypothetical protein
MRLISSLVEGSVVRVTLTRIAVTFVANTLVLIALSTFGMAHAGSVYVPLDSWSYAAAERLAALTGTRTEVMGMRPWTRSQFAHFLQRARDEKHGGEAESLQKALEKEFEPELNSDPEHHAVESTYTRSTQIAGTPLRDSYHLVQTFADDFGRPYGQGFNNVTGASGYLQDRAGLLYVRGEYQHGASLRTPSAEAIARFALADVDTPEKVTTQGGPEVDNPRLLDTYVGVSFGHFTGTLGKQSLWWGPATGGAMLFSNNIEPIWMARLTNDVPYKIPILGQVRIDMMYGKLQGYKYEPQSWMHSEKITVQPFKNVEFGFTRTVIFLGVDYPLSFNRLVHSYFSVGDNNASPLPQNNPGDRRGGLDFSWKLPKIPVTLYSDSFCNDDPSPLANPARSAFHPGFYVARFPGALAKFDFRMEGAYTASENPTSPNGFNYWKEDYRDGYTNKGMLIGDTVGRAGVSGQVWGTYWLSSRDKIQVSYLHHYISPKFLAGPGTQNVLKATTVVTLKHSIELELGAQSERVIMPVLTGNRTPQYDVSGWAGVKYWPEHKAQD